METSIPINLGQITYTLWKKFILYRVCHGFRLTEQNDYFESLLTTFEASIIF